jgi:hypothetical protein
VIKQKKIKNSSSFILLVSVFLVSSLDVFAQGPPPPPPPPGLPIDGGILFLAASAFVYGIRKLKN